MLMHDNCIQQQINTHDSNRGIPPILERYSIQNSPVKPCIHSSVTTCTESVTEYDGRKRLY